MPSIVKDNWWKLIQTADLALFTANATVTQDGRLVMGRGLAKQVRDFWPGIDARFGRALKVKDSPNYGIYILNAPMLKLTWPKEIAVGAFQVKWHWQHAARLELIENSITVLNGWLNKHPEVGTVVLNYPGIGNGRLNREDVEPLLQFLDDRVTVVYQ